MGFHDALSVDTLHAALEDMVCSRNAECDVDQHRQDEVVRTASSDAAEGWEASEAHLVRNLAELVLDDSRTDRHRRASGTDSCSSEDEIGRSEDRDHKRHHSRYCASAAEGGPWSLVHVWHLVAAGRGRKYR